jgi:pimeloyl-ACP methyl ester carboxylesterase
MTAHFVRDGVRIAYEDAGAGEPAMVFVHGWCCERSHFAPQVAHFGAAHRCVSVDLRGHGESDVPDGGYAIASMADDVAALCAHLGLKKPVVVGHSMGGAVTLSLAARHPDLPSAIVMLDGAHMPRGDIIPLVEPVSAAFHGDAWRDALGGIFGQMFIETDDVRLRERLTAAALARPQHVVAGCWDAMWANDTMADIARCRVPAMYVGSQTPIADMVKLREAMPDAMLAQTAGAGHFHQLVVPEQVNAMIERFLAVRAKREPRT